MQPSDTTIYLIQHLSAVIERQANQILLERLGVSYAKYKVLSTIKWHDQALSQRFIADALRQTEASISRQVKLLIDKGMVISTVSPKSRREHLVQITFLGMRLIAEAQAVLGPSYEQLLALIGKKSQRYLGQSLDTIHQNLCPNDNQACRLLTAAIR